MSSTCLRLKLESDTSEELALLSAFLYSQPCIICHGKSCGIALYHVIV